jgi:cytidyltransferase-like protein
MNKMIFNTFLTSEQLNNLSKWKYKVIDNGFMSKILMPLYDYIALLIPRSISPNILSLTGLLMSIYAWYLSYQENNFINNFFVGLFIFIYMVLDAVDGKHARNNNISSPLGELIDHFCDCITNVLLTVTICNVYNFNDIYKRYLLIYIMQQLFFLEHLKAYYHKTLVFNEFTGPTEAICSIIFLIWTKSFLELVGDINIFIDYMYMLIVLQYFWVFASSTIKLFPYIDKQTMFIHIIFDIIQYFKYYFNDSDYISNGIILSILSVDIILAKMANRPLHPLIALFYMITCIYPSCGIPLVLIYFIINTIDISNYMNIPIINTQTNVFVCGYYDGLHIGHTESLKNALTLGTNLIVGIHSQNDLIQKLKNKNQEPYEKNEVIRFFKVKNLPFVTKIIKDSPSDVLTQEFIKKHQIHIVGMSDEYIEEIDSNNNIVKVLPYYKIALEMGILKIIPRTKGISSTELRQF